ncbi:hypothetical protein CP533_6756 [Ophiocordyceps camponoti-saundersi (nom. inval.)]|nr:hypothetical protein CP533_6756 [Ophiocordyceps camponoti-saundersi (nom. inval.)]
MDAMSQSPPSPPQLPFAPQPSDLYHRQSDSGFLSPSRSHSDTEGESCTLVESDLEPVEDTESASPDEGVSTVGLNRPMADLAEEASAPVCLGLSLNPDDASEKIPSEELLKRCFDETNPDTEPANFTNDNCITVTSHSEPVEALADNISTSGKSNSMLQSAAQEATTEPSRADVVETILPSIKSDSDSTKAETRHDHDHHVRDAFATSLENLENCVEEWAWTRDEIVPRRPEEAIRDQLLEMTQAAHNALQALSEADLRQGHDEQDVGKDGYRGRSEMINSLHALLSRVFATFEAHLSTWSESKVEEEEAVPTRAATVDADDEEMSFAMDMIQKNRDLETKIERLEREITELEWRNHNLRQSDEASKEKLESLTKKTASCNHGEHDVVKEDMKPSSPAKVDSPRIEQVEWPSPTPEDSPSTGSSRRIDWRQKFFSEQTRAIEAEQSKQDCEKELEDVRWEVKGLERDLKASQSKEKQLEQRLTQRQTQEADDDDDLVQGHEIVPWDSEPQTLFNELGSLTNSSRQSLEPFMSNNDEPRTTGRPAGSPAQIASVLAREEYTAWTDVFLFISFLWQWLSWLLTGFIFQGLLRLPILRRIPGKDWQPMAKPEKSYRTDGLVRALRQVMLLLSLHAYLSCRAERSLWLSANTRQIKFYLRRELAHGRPWWIVPGVDPTILLYEANELMAPVLAQTMDVWFPVVVNWWRGQLDRYV